jgi:cobyrinic acid a,c-diamide synthase
VRRLVIAGAASGVGKTTVACALLAGVRARGLRVQPFKAGPDYIDPGYHEAAAGLPSRTLDSFLLPPDVLRGLFADAARRADIAVVEGMMGLFDGRDGLSETGSTAEIAKLLGAPVIVVLDVAAAARSAGAIALGCARFDPALAVVGFVLNKVAGETHARWAREAVELATGLPVLGAIPLDPRLALPERHLGLVPIAERALTPTDVDHLAQVAEQRLDLDRMLALADRPWSAGPGPEGLSPDASAARVPIAIARDEAFHFYYPDSLELLERSGAELVPFSPLRDRALPRGVRGAYIGGGFPELFAGALADNREMHASLRTAAARDVVLYAECGGLMYVGETLTDLDGRAHRMVGLVPARSEMTRDRLTLGYRTARALRASPLLGEGEVVRGHEFHWSTLAAKPARSASAYAFTERPGQVEGFAADRLLASYLHLHFGTRPEMARRFVARCAATVCVPA